MPGGPPTRSRIEAWEQTAGGLAESARDWRANADLLERVADVYGAQVAAPGGTEWRGPGAAAVLAGAEADRRAVYRGVEHARRLADVADQGADGLRWGRQRALAAIADAEADGFRVAEDLSLADRLCSDMPDAYRARLHAARVYRDQIRCCAARLQSEDERIATQLDAGVAQLTGVAHTVWAADDLPAAEPPDIPPPDTSPAEVHRWWGRSQQARLIAEHPPELGNLNGIPATVRDEVNRAVMNDDIARVEDTMQACGIAPEDLQNPGHDVFRTPEKYGLSRIDITRYRNATQTKAGLKYDRGDGVTADRPALLWAYDPVAFGGQGVAAIAIGNPDEAQNTTVIVPGTGSSVAQGWMADHVDAVNVYEQSVHADPTRSTAVIAWMGYDAPDGFGDRRVTEPGLARRGGELLARDVNGLWVTHRGVDPQHVTVIGHSYGATTVADACARSRLHANDVILLGCPGTDLARSAADFHLDGGQVYVGAASTDPVSWIGQTDGVPGELLKNELRQHGVPLPADAGLGPDPAGQGFGSIRFHAEVPGSEQLNRHDHAHYYQLGSEALRSMTDIVTGHADRLTADGLVAEGRRQPHVGTPPELRIPGLPPIPLPHLDTRIPGLPAYIDPEGDRHAVRDDHAYE
ncbi:alpha/beta hydrolase [Mycobacterium sp. pUA109]|uniref:alpha/beta hydrolase n=1 Tax=Mycobacterium sp. pUA109 TaxID=3238982 RepID=UPI00351B5587